MILTGEMWSVWFSRLSTLDGSRSFSVGWAPKKEQQTSILKDGRMDLGSLPWLHFVVGISWFKDLKVLITCMHLCCILVLCRSIFGDARDTKTPCRCANPKTDDCPVQVANRSHSWSFFWGHNFWKKSFYILVFFEDRTSTCIFFMDNYCIIVANSVLVWL